jgi:hypothetical protein
VTAYEVSIFLYTTLICSGTSSNPGHSRGFEKNGCDNEVYGPLSCGGSWFVKMQMFQRNTVYRLQLHGREACGQPLQVPTMKMEAICYSEAPVSLGIAVLQPKKLYSSE